MKNTRIDEIDSKTLSQEFLSVIKKGDSIEAYRLLHFASADAKKMIAGMGFEEKKLYEEAYNQAKELCKKAEKLIESKNSVFDFTAKECELVNKAKSAAVITKLEYANAVQDKQDIFGLNSLYFHHLGQKLDQLATRTNFKEIEKKIKKEGKQYSDSLFDNVPDLGNDTLKKLVVNEKSKSTLITKGNAKQFFDKFYSLKDPFSLDVTIERIEDYAYNSAYDGIKSADDGLYLHDIINNEVMDVTDKIERAENDAYNKVNR